MLCEGQIHVNWRQSVSLLSIKFSYGRSGELYVHPKRLKIYKFFLWLFWVENLRSHRMWPTTEKDFPSLFLSFQLITSLCQRIMSQTSANTAAQNFYDPKIFLLSHCEQLRNSLDISFPLFFLPIHSHSIPWHHIRTQISLRESFLPFLYS